jgi:hypothetical protein
MEDTIATIAIPKHRAKKTQTPTNKVFIVYFSLIHRVAKGYTANDVYKNDRSSLGALRTSRGEASKGHQYSTAPV